MKNATIHLNVTYVNQILIYESLAGGGGGGYTL